MTELARQCNGGAEEALIAAWAAVFSRCDRRIALPSPKLCLKSDLLRRGNLDFEKASVLMR